MTSRLVLDPVTRIEGHLRIEAETAADGTITAAYASGTMVRGLELVLRGRDPRDAWAFAQRICGVCTLVHGLASVRAVENALDYPIPANARLIRNLMLAAQFVHDHVMHFYHLHALDWVDIRSALDADPKAASALARSLSPDTPSSPASFASVQQRLRDFFRSGQAGIFANGYWGHPEYRLPAEANLVAAAHYLDALAWQREAAKLHALFGGRNPHPNLLVGGAPQALTVAVLSQAGDIIRQMQDFVSRIYLPDALAIASFYRDWFQRGEGVGNFLVCGGFPETDAAGPSGGLIPAGVILDRDPDRFEPLDLQDPAQAQEFTAHSWYEYSDGKTAGLHPFDGQTRLNYSGPKPPYAALDTERGYSWLKAPRWRGKAMETGPLARLLMLHAAGHEATRELTRTALARLDLPFSALFSTFGRTLARALETKIIADWMPGWLDALKKNVRKGDLSVHNASLWEPSTWKREARGVGFTEAPRGALAHWVHIREGRIENYQVVAPSTWNAGPRDAAGQPGPYEAALADRHRLHDAARPLEILRTVHSFDPCIACAVHLMGPNRETLAEIHIR